MSLSDTETVFVMAVADSFTTVTMGDLSVSAFPTLDDADDLNSTTLAPGIQPPYWDLYVVIILTVILSVVMVISIIGNALIILTMIFFKGMRSKTNLFITNLACADLGVSILCMPFSLATVIKGDWLFGTVLCNMNAFFEALFLVASTHGLMAIALHKFFSLVLPLKRIINLRRALGMVIFAWFIGFTCAIGPLVGLTENIYKPGTSQCGPKYPEKLKEKLIGFYVPVVGIIVPLTCLIIAYSIIFNTIRKYSHRLRHHTSMTEEKIFNQQKRITITLFIVFVAFFICWAPYFVYSSLGFSLGFQKVPTMLNVISYWSGYTNSALNPMIYAWRAKSYRKAFRRIFCCNVHGGVISDTGTVNNGEFTSPAPFRHSRVYQGSRQGTLPVSQNSSLSSILRLPPVPRQTPGNQPINKACRDHVQLQQLPSNGITPHCIEVPTHSDEDDVFVSDVSMKRSNSEGDKVGLERRHFDSSPRVRDRFACHSDPWRNRLKKSLSNGCKHQEEEQQTITSSNWELDVKARRALLGRSTIV